MRPMRWIGVALLVGSGCAVPTPATVCPCEVDPQLAGQHRQAWIRAFEGTPLDDADLQALSDAQDFLECQR